MEIPTDQDEEERGPSQMDSEEKKEWKKRIKMYRESFSSVILYDICHFAQFLAFSEVGPAIEAFGYERIIFGSSPAASSTASASNAGDWYSLARECIAEMGIEQSGVDAVFGANAKKIYGRGSAA